MVWDDPAVGGFGVESWYDEGLTADEEGEGREVILGFVDDDDAGLLTTMPCGGGDGEAKSDEGGDGESGETAETRSSWR